MRLATNDFQKFVSYTTWRIVRRPAMFGMRQLQPTRSPGTLRYSPIGFEEAPMYLPCDGRSTFAKADSRQNW